MKIGRSLNDVAAEITRQAASKKDYIADTRQLTLRDDGKTLAINGTAEVPLTDLALTQVGDRVGVPLKYLRRMQADAPDLLAANVNRWFQQQPEARMVRTLDDKGRAFLSNRYARVDNFDVASTVLPVLQKVPGLNILSTEVTETKLYIKASTSALTREVKSRRVGDMVEAGVMVSNSEVGLGAVVVTPFARFLVCLNGMQRDGGQRWNHLGKMSGAQESAYVLLTDETKQAEDKALLLKVRDTLTSALDETVFDRWVKKLEGATERQLTGDVPRAVEVLGSTLGLTQAEQGNVLRHLIEGGDLSQYGLINAVTRTAEDMESYDRASDLEALGGRVLDLTPAEWKTIQLAA